MSKNTKAYKHKKKHQLSKKKPKHESIMHASHRLIYISLQGNIQETNTSTRHVSFPTASHPSQQDVIFSHIFAGLWFQDLEKRFQNDLAHDICK
jgi:hypothetical protein